MSPPCVATIFEGDNGGTTTQGVSSTEVRVAVAWNGTAPATSSIQQQVVGGLFEYFNRRFELYGRRLVPVYVSTNAGSDAGASRAAATNIAAQQVFGAVTGVMEQYGYPGTSFAQELARQKIVAVLRGSGRWWADAFLYDTQHPYLWSVYPSAEDEQANLAEFVCGAYAGGKVAFTNDAALLGRNRKVGLAVVGGQLPPSTKALRAGLAACDVEPSMFELTSSTLANAKTGFERMKADGVTTVVCVCEGSLHLSTFSAANQAGFRPEWILGSTSFSTDEDNLQGYTKCCMAPPVRLDAGPRVIPKPARPWYQALYSIDPDLGGRFGDKKTIQDVFLVAEVLYDQLAVLASGIQGAGPILTAESFGAALMGMAFPNPGAGAPPYWQPSAGFGPGDHSFYDDYAIGWWSDTVEAGTPWGSPFGSFCFVGGGTRFRLGTYTHDLGAMLFNSAAGCR